MDIRLDIDLVKHARIRVWFALMKLLILVFTFNKRKILNSKFKHLLSHKIEATVIIIKNNI